MNTILNRVKKDNIKFIQLQFTDILGAVKNISIPAYQLEKAIEEGIFFDGSSVLGYATIEESDMRLMPEIETFCMLPWISNNMKTIRIICKVYTSDRKRFSGDPRFVLENIVNKAKARKYVFNVGPEYEFFLMQTENGRPTVIPSDHGTYFDLMCDKGDEIRKEIVEYLTLMNFAVEASHHEVAPGQHEIDLKYADAITSADRVAMMKYVTKTIALSHNLYATFMPKPIYGVCGSGMHTHMSLMNKKKNIFYDENDKYQLSDKAYYFIGGLLKYAKETCGIMASWVNSYKRLVPGYEAPVYISWANKNRSALIRVPAGKGMSTRVELRNPDPAGNPYLQFALMLAAGLEGIDKKHIPPEAIEQDIYKLSIEERKKLKIESLPENLGHALALMKESKLVKNTLGEHLFNHYLYVKTQEWESYRSRVTEWEIENLLPIL